VIIKQGNVITDVFMIRKGEFEVKRKLYSSSKEQFLKEV